MSCWTKCGTIVGLARVTALVLCLASTACSQISPYKTWECHHSIAQVMEWRGNCVIYEAIVEEARKLTEMGARPYSLRMNGESLAALAAENQVVRHRLSSGGALWVVDTTYGAMRVVKDDRLEFMQFIVGRGWDVKQVEDDSVRAEPSTKLEPSLHNPDNDVEF